MAATAVVAAEADAIYAAVQPRGRVRLGDVVLESTESELPGQPSDDVAVICLDAETRAVRWAVRLGNASADTLTLTA